MIYYFKFKITKLLAIKIFKIINDKKKIFL